MRSQPERPQAAPESGSGFQQGIFFFYLGPNSNSSITAFARRDKFAGKATRMVLVFLNRRRAQGIAFNALSAPRTPNVGAGLAPPNKGTASRAPTRTRCVPPPWKPRLAQLRASLRLRSRAAGRFCLHSWHPARRRCSSFLSRLRLLSSFILHTSSFSLNPTQLR